MSKRRDQSPNITTEFHPIISTTVSESMDDDPSIIFNIITKHAHTTLTQTLTSFLVDTIIFYCCKYRQYFSANFHPDKTHEPYDTNNVFHNKVGCGHGPVNIFINTSTYETNVNMFAGRSWKLLFRFVSVAQIEIGSATYIANLLGLDSIFELRMANLGRLIL